jgi:hypothetical protein
MKRTSIVLLIGTSFAVAAWAQTPALLMKGTVPQLASANPDVRTENRTVNVVLRLYDAKQNGTLLFEERQTVYVDEAGIFDAVVGSATSGGLPAKVTDGRGTVWGAYELPGIAAANATTERQQITYQKTNDLAPNAWVFVPTSTVLCYTCGGSWPYTVGIFRTPYYVNGTFELGSACASPRIYRTDTAPRLCSRD